jgi:SSS family solute:Na+ symporter
MTNLAARISLLAAIFFSGRLRTARSCRRHGAIASVNIEKGRSIVPNLASADWLILLIFAFFALSAGSALKLAMTGGREYLEAGRALPAWLCGLALAAAGLGLQIPFLLGLGARCGLQSILYTVLGGVPALLVLGLLLMPAYYGSKARTLPEFLGQRFGSKVRLLAASLLLLSAVIGAALVLLVLARIFVAAHLLDEPMRAAGMGARGIYFVSMAAPATLVLAYVLLGGLAGSIYNQALQLLLFTAGLFPAVLLSLKQVGWSGLQSAAALAGSSFAFGGTGAGHALAAGLSLVFGFCFWCADFRVVQTAMAAKDAAAARRAPLIAAALWLVLPLFVIVPAIAALAMPTPRTTTFVRNDNGVIYHEINVVPAAEENGQGLVPAIIDPATGKPLHGANGRTVLNDEMAAPDLLVHFLPFGLLGLGLAALVACAMSGVSASLSAFSAVFVRDIYQAHFHKEASEGSLLAAGRWTAAGCMALVFGLASAAYFWSLHLDKAALVLAGLHAPLLVAILFAVFGKRQHKSLTVSPTSQLAAVYDARITMGMLFTLAGTILAAFGLGTRNQPSIYARSLGMDANLWWGAVLLVFGVIVLLLGRSGQMQLEKGKTAKRKK